MRCSFPFGLRETVTVAILSCFIVGGVGLRTRTSATESARTVAVSVNRTNKGDRLPQSSILSGYPNDHSGAASGSSAPRRPPFGCDSAFSPISAPVLAHIFKRCLA
jgi:hypothetical protein